MDVITKDIYKALNYIVTEYKVTEDGKIVDTFYNIRNQEGLVFSQNYSDIKQPLDILISIERLVMNPVNQSR